MSSPQQHIPRMYAANALADMDKAITSLKEGKPEDRSELDRVYAVTITMTEQALAYFKVYAVDILDRKVSRETG